MSRGAEVSERGVTVVFKESYIEAAHNSASNELQA